MIINNTQPTLKTGNIKNETVNMQIKNNAAMFSILSEKLYQNPIRAVIRELSCNAYDSHIMAGKKDVPITCNLPTILDPTFYVEDEGVGMSEEEVLTLFFTLGGTNKSDNNTTIGGFGLGSKSPYAVTDTYTIETSKDGKGAIFICSKDKGVPTIVKVGSTTGKPNGVKVSFLVDTKDIYRYAQEAGWVFSVWPNTPKGNITSVIPTYEENKAKPLTIKYKDFEKVFNNVLQHPYVGCVCMGNVMYYADSLPTSKYTFVLPIGSVGITPSRESVITDDTFNKVITNVYNKFREEFEVTVKEVKEKYGNSYLERNLIENIITKDKNSYDTQVCYLKHNYDTNTYFVDGKYSSSKDYWSITGRGNAPLNTHLQLHLEEGKIKCVNADYSIFVDDLPKDLSTVVKNRYIRAAFRSDRGSTIIVADAYPSFLLKQETVDEINTNLKITDYDVENGLAPKLTVESLRMMVEEQGCIKYLSALSPEVPKPRAKPTNTITRDGRSSVVYDSVECKFNDDELLAKSIFEAVDKGYSLILFEDFFSRKVRHTNLPPKGVIVAALGVNTKKKLDKLWEEYPEYEVAVTATTNNSEELYDVAAKTVINSFSKELAITPFDMAFLEYTRYNYDIPFFCQHYNTNTGILIWPKIRAVYEELTRVLNVSNIADYGLTTFIRLFNRMVDLEKRISPIVVSDSYEYFYRALRETLPSPSDTELKNVEEFIKEADTELNKVFKSNNTGVTTNIGTIINYGFNYVSTEDMAKMVVKLLIGPKV